MKSRIFVTALAIVGLGIIDAQTANAAPRFFITAAGNWNTAADWDNEGCDNNALGGNGTVPTSSDDVVICRGMTATVDAAAVARSIEVEENATVAIAVATLDITGVDLTHRIVGKITLTASTSSILLFSENATISGGGLIDGAGTANSPQIQITSGKTLRLDSRTRMEGQLLLVKPTGEADATFINDGIVHADAAATLDLQSLVLKQGSGGLYMVSTNASAILKFSSTATATALSNDFRVEAGTLDIDTDLITSGTLYYSGGTVDCVTNSPDCIFAHAEAH